MNKMLALRAGLFFALLGGVLGVLGLSSGATLAGPLVAIAASMAALLALLGTLTPQPVPVRVARRSPRR